MQGAVASSGWESTRSRLAVTWQGCLARQPGLLAAFPWPSQARPFMDVPWQGESCVLAHDLYNPGPSRRVCDQGQEGLTVRGHSSSQAVCPAPSLPPPPCWICSCPPRLSGGGAAAACGGCLRWVPAVGACGGCLWCARSTAVLCLPLQAQQSPRGALRCDSTSHVRPAANPDC